MKSCFHYTRYCIAIFFIALFGASLFFLSNYASAASYCITKNGQKECRKNLIEWDVAEGFKYVEHNFDYTISNALFEPKKWYSNEHKTAAARGFCNGNICISDFQPVFDAISQRERVVNVDGMDKKFYDVEFTVIGDLVDKAMTLDNEYEDFDSKIFIAEDNRFNSFKQMVSACNMTSFLETRLTDKKYKYTLTFVATENLNVSGINCGILATTKSGYRRRFNFFFARYERVPEITTFTAESLNTSYPNVATAEIIWVPRGSDVLLRWNTHNVGTVELQCSGSCPDNLTQINDEIRYKRSGGVDTSGIRLLPQGGAVYTLIGRYGNYSVSKSIRVITRDNEYSEWRAITPLTGKKILRNDGKWEYGAHYIDSSTANQSVLPTIKISWSGEGGERYCAEPVFDGSCRRWSTRAPNYNVATDFDFMSRPSYDVARNLVESGAGFVLTRMNGDTKQSVVIDSIRKFESNVGPPPCLDASYDLSLLFSSSLNAAAALTPAYRCGLLPNGTYEKSCIDYAPICVGEDLQHTWTDRPPQSFTDHACTLRGIKSRLVKCVGVPEADIRWKERGSYDSERGVAVIINFLTAVVMAQFVPSQQSSEWTLQKPSVAETDLRCTPATCGMIPSPILPAANEGKVRVGVGKQGGMQSQVNQFIVNDAVEQARPRNADGTGGFGHGPKDADGFVVINPPGGTIPLWFAETAVTACNGNQRCLNFAKATSPRINQQTLDVTPASRW